MMDHDRTSLQQFIQSAQPMPPALCATITDQFAPLAFAKGEFLLREEQVADRYLFLAHGLMRAYTHSPEGDEVTTAFFAEGQVVFEVDSFFNRTPSRENIVALSDVRGFSLTFEQLNALFHAYPEFREFGRSILVRGFARLKQRMVNMIHLTAEQRYALLMRNEPHVLLHVPLKHVASYLGITDTSLSRIRKTFTKA
jgi:CRP-like cAMP-binding protein